MKKIELYSEDINYKLYHGSMLDMLEVIEPNTIDSIVTDPPYELNFMGKGWDNAGISFNKDTWKKCFEVLKPGGYLLAFGGSRTFHRIACAIEDAGFEIRDTIMWLYGSGFPKSMDIEKSLNKKDGVEFESIKWKGWGTCLKPSFEPIIVARKSFKGSLVDNVIKWGVGGLNIDNCRIKFNGDIPKASGLGRKKENHTSYSIPSLEEKWKENPAGRFPANLILTYDETDYDEVCGGFPQCHKAGNKKDMNRESYNASSYKIVSNNNPDYYKDSGSASRYFYCAKASKKDRDEGLDKFETKSHEEINNRKEGSAGATRQYGGGTNPFLSVSCPRKNTHPTVKPTELMQYLVRLVSPKGATILDCFNGSGSTGKAIMYENKERNADYKYIGIELTEEYLPIAKARIDYVKNEMK